MVGFGGSLDLVLLWLWCRLAAAAPIQPLAWEPPYAVGVAIKSKKKKKKKHKKQTRKTTTKKTHCQTWSYCQSSCFYFAKYIKVGHQH